MQRNRKGSTMNMNLERTLPSGERQQVAEIREALGAVAAAEPAVFWVYCDPSGSWCTRREGDLEEDQFTNRADACDHVRMAAARCRAYRLFIARPDGRFAEESFNWRAPRRHRHPSVRHAT
jgi:hypothetical protein